jgi:ferredoxin-NADP reductase
MKLLARVVLPPAAPAAVRARRRLAQLGRDLRALGDGLRGVHPSPLIARPRRAPRFATPPEPRAGDARSALERSARVLRISEVRRETADAVSLVLADPTGAPLSCRPGQFFTLLVDVGGERLRRAYSASWIDPGGREVAVTIKRVAGGRVSNHLNDTARPGDLVSVLGPSGDFVVDGAGPRHLVLIGAGSGITPLVAIARDRAGAAGSRVSLIYGNRSPAAILFAAELDALAAAGAVTVRHVLEEPGDAAARRGRLDEDVLAAELAAVAAGDDPATEYFVCGPAPVMDAARAVLARRGVPASQIREERFASPAAPRAEAGSAQVVTLRRPGQAGQSVVVAPGATILDAGLAAGLAMPFSCAMGGCGACAVRLVDGEVDVDEPSCLTADERARGVVLACVARPRGACTLELPR